MAANAEIPTLDSVDRSILEILQRDGRESFTRIGQRVGLSSTAVAERVRRLEQVGVIAGYRAELVASHVGFPITAFLLARSTGPDARFSEAVQSRPEIIECYRVTGEVSFVLRAVLAKVEQLEELIDYLEKTSYVTTLVVLSASLKRAGLPLARVDGGSGRRPSKRDSRFVGLLVDKKRPR